MNCFCRTTYHVFTHSQKTSFSALVKLPLSTYQVRRSISQAMFLEDKNIFLQASQDMKWGEKVFKKSRDKFYYDKYLEKCFSKEFSPSYLVGSIHTSCNECESPPEIISSLLLKIFDFQKENNIQLDFTVDQKKEILKSFLKPKYLNFVNLVCSLFKISAEPHSVKEIVDELIQNKDYIKAAYCIGALNLQKEYDIEKIIIPLLLHENISPVVSCITNLPDLQLKVAQILDDLLVVKKVELTNPVYKQSKSVYKSLSSIVNIFKIPSENCKNLHLIRSRAAINLLIKKKVQQSLSESSFEDMVMIIISKNPQLKEHLINKLVAKNDIDAAEKMILKLDMKDFDLLSVIESMKKMALPITLEDDEIDDTSEEHEVLQLSLDKSCIHFIDTKEEFLKCIDEITQNYNLIGIDSEWKPSFGLAEERLSLVQLAVKDKVYILDIISLHEALQNKLWDTLIDDVFASSKIVKLGCNIMSDVKMIVGSNKGNTGRTMRFSHILDMSIFYRKLQEIYPEKFTMDKDDNFKNQLGLSRLCKIMLGKSLSKEERLCNWEKRPLTEMQLQYAALDAFCLLQVYDALKIRALENDMKFDHLAKVSIVLTSSLSKTRRRVKREKMKQLLSGDGFLVQNPISIQKFRVVIDSQLKTLGNELQRFGADVLFLSNVDTAETVVEIANSEERLLICTESLWSIVQDKVSQGFCVDEIGDVEEVTASHIIQRFNVRLSMNHMSSKCLVCQSKDVVRLSNKNIDFLQKWTSNKMSINESDLEMDSFPKRIIELTKSGIKIKLKEDSSSFPVTTKHICLKCGVMQ